MHMSRGVRGQRSSRAVVAALSWGAVAFAGCADRAEFSEEEAHFESQQQALQSSIITDRSLVVTEEPILQRFGFERVMQQLASQSGVPGLTALGLFQQWWDTQNPAGEAVGTGPNCSGSLNTYPYVCRPRSLGQEGAEALSNPFSNPASNPAAYIPIGLFNRFDLAPADGSNCGEHRIVYARRSGIGPESPPNPQRNLIIFEATMPNPHAGQGLKGCDKIVKFWGGLSKTSSLTKRADDLEKFYFQGVANLPPVVNIAHFGDNPTGVGQLRTNQFMQPGASPPVWNLREFKLLRTCAAGACSAMTVIPVSVKTNPFGGLFQPASGAPQKVDFDAHFVGQVEALAAGTVATIDMKTPEAFNAAQSLASGSPLDNYVTQFAGPSGLRDAIQTALTGLGSALTPDNIVSRARALSCAGCHRFNNNTALGGDLTWPASLGFTHIGETASVGSDGVSRFPLSPALITSFLPVRKQVMDDFLNDKPPNTKSPKDPIGGRRVH